MFKARNSFLKALFWGVLAFNLFTTTVLATPVQRGLVSGCGQKLPEGQQNGQVTNVSITSSDIDRSYLVFVPANYSEFFPVPVIISYHGGARNAQDQLELDLMTDPMWNEGFMVIYPQGINESWQGVPNDTTNDIQFTLDILGQIEGQYCIDELRIYATGKSDGGGFCNLAACDANLSNKFAAFASVSGAYYVDTLPCLPNSIAIPCQPGRPNIPMMAFHGGADTTVPFAGEERKGECLPSITHWIQQWAQREYLPNTNLTIPITTDVVHYIFGPDLLGGEVSLYYESNIKHDWPATFPNADNQEPGHGLANYNATPIILDYFNKHTLLL